jgi:hypothetical protein
MRVSAVLVLAAAAMLAPGFAMADPALPQPVNSAPPAIAAAPSNAVPAATNQNAVAPVSAGARARPATDETVIVNGRVRKEDMLDRFICHAEAPRTGSRLGAESECHTVREWNDLRKASQSSLDNIQIRALSGGYGR